jgi:hypothetical protein
VAFQAENSVLDEYTDGVQTQGVELPGLYLLDPDVGYFGGPLIYLDFDGAQDITYNGPVVVEGIDIPEFSADAAGLAGQEQQIISQILIELERTFQGSGVIFTSTEPDFGTEYSTILIGGDDSAFGAYGRFWGLAEKVDVGNQDPGDDALVFSEVIASCDLDKEVFAKSLADVIAHEAGHLLGYAHRVPGSPGRILDDVAETVTWSGEIPDGTVWSGGDISADPLYVDPANGVFELSRDSPAIDAAWEPDVPLTDLYGRPWFDDRTVPNTGGASSPSWT